MNTYHVPRIMVPFFNNECVQELTTTPLNILVVGSSDKGETEFHTNEDFFQSYLLMRAKQ
jgi:hypothetical protein